MLLLGKAGDTGPESIESSCKGSVGLNPLFGLIDDVLSVDPGIDLSGLIARETGEIQGTLNIFIDRLAGERGSRDILGKVGLCGLRDGVF